MEDSQNLKEDDVDHHQSQGSDSSEMMDLYVLQARFQSEVLNLCDIVQKLVAARHDTIDKIRASAEYLDSLWLRCRVGKTMGTSVSVVGGGLTIAGGILTTLTAGAAAPVLIAGIATSSVGAATNIGTSLIEKILNSKQVKDMNDAFNADKEITTSFETKLQEIKEKYQESPYLSRLYYSIKKSIGEEHLLIPVLQLVLLYDSSDSSKTQEPTSSTAETKSSLPSRPAIFSGCSSTDKMKFNPVDPGMLGEAGKVIGQNSLRVAGQVVIGVSAAFLVWDAIDLGFSVSDLIKKRGSDSAKVLRDKASHLENALHDTLSNYKVDIV